MQIEVDITNGTIQDGKVVDWTNPDTVVLIGADYQVAPEDENDQPVDPRNGLHYYGSEIHFSSPLAVAADAAEALREQAERLFHEGLGYEATGKTDFARSCSERRTELLRIAGMLDGTIKPHLEEIV